MRSLILALVLGILVALPRPAGAVAWTKEVITYTPPEGFVPEVGGPSDRIVWLRHDGDRSCEITIFLSHASPAVQAAADQKQTWATMIDANFHTGPAGDAMRSALPDGVEVLGNIALAQTPKGPAVLLLLTAHGLDRSVPILIVAPTTDALKTYQAAIDGFAASLIIHKPYERPANLPSQPLRVSIADLAGDWQQGGADVITYVNSSGGYAGSNTTFFNTVYHVQRDGSYTSATAGMTGGNTVRESIAGKMSLDGEFLTITQNGHSTIRRRLVLFYVGPNGTVMGAVEPERTVDLGNITANGAYWVRKK